MALQLIQNFKYFQEFPSNDDTCYLAHCYPYTFSDLQNDLDALEADPKRSVFMKRDVLCLTRAGNSCFLLTISDFGELMCLEIQNLELIV